VGSNLNPISIRGSDLPGFPVRDNLKTHSFTLSEQHLFSPTTINPARISFFRHKFHFDQRLNRTSPRELGFAGLLHARRNGHRAGQSHSLTGLHIPLDIDKPVDAGIAAFCDTCRACRIYCPADAIPDDRSPEAGKDPIGKDRYIVDTGKCFPYFAKHNSCSICLPVCVYNHKEWARDFEGFQTKLFPKVIMHDPPPPTDLPEEKRHHYIKLGRE